MIINLPKLGPVRFKDNISDEEFQAALNHLSTKYDFELPKRDYGLMGSFTKGVSRGATRMGETFGDVLPALGASALGFDEYAQKQLAEAKATEEKLARENPAQFESYKQVGGVRDAAKYALETLGEVTPDIAGMIASGGVGSTIAKRGATKLAEKELAAITPGLVETGASAEELAQVAGRVGAESLAKKQAQGQGVGVYLGSYAMNAPEVFQSIYNDSGQLAPGASLLFGSVSAALDSVLPASVLRSMSPAAKVKVTEEILKQSGMRPGLASNIGKSVLKGAGTEGLTEGAQEAINIAAQGFVNENRDMWTSKDFQSIVENSVRGAIGGGAFGTVGGFAKTSQEKAAVQEQQDKDLAGIQAERDRQANIASQAQAELAAQQQAEAQRSQANLPLPLPGFEEAVGPTMQVDETQQAAAPEVVPAGQQSLFGLTGKPTTEALASVKTGVQQQLASEKAAQAEQAKADAEQARIAADQARQEKLTLANEKLATPEGTKEVLGSLNTPNSYFEGYSKADQNRIRIQLQRRLDAFKTKDADLQAQRQKELEETFKAIAPTPVTELTSEKLSAVKLSKKNRTKLTGLDLTKKEDYDVVANLANSTDNDAPTAAKLLENIEEPVVEKDTVLDKEANPPEDVDVLKSEEKLQEAYKEDLKKSPPLSGDKVMGTSKAPLVKEEVPEIVSNFITSQIRDSVRTDLDNEGVPARAEGRNDLEQLEASHIQKNIDKKALMYEVVEPLRIVNILREVLDLKSLREDPTEQTQARIAELENVIAGFKGDLPNIYKQLQSASPEQVNSYFDSLNVYARETLNGLVNKAREKAYPKSKTKRVFIPEDTNKNNVYDIVDKRKQELGIKETKDVTVKEAAQRLLSEIDKFIGKGGRAYMVEETPPEILKALTQMIEAIVREGVRSLKDVSARIRQEFGDNVFRMIKKKDIATLFNQEMKKYKTEKAGATQREQASQQVNAPATVYNSLPVGDQKIYDGALNAYSNAEDTVQKGMLRLWSLNDLIDVFGKKFPTLKDLLTAIEKRASTSTKYREKVSELVRKGDKIIKNLTPEMAEKFNDIVLEISRLKLDPRPANTKDANHPEVRRFRALPKELQDYAIELADQYDAYGKQYLDFLVNQIPMKNNREYLTNVEKMKNKFESGRIPFYFPLLRSGDYWVSYKDSNGERVVFARESKREAEKLALEIAKAGGTEISQYTQMSQMDHRTAPPTGFMAEIIKDLQVAKVSDTVINGIYSSYLDLFPSESLRQQFKPREGLKGYEKDIVQGFAQVGSRMAQQLANMEYSPDIGRAVAGVKAAYDAQPTMENRNVLDAIMRQESFLSNPVAEPLASRLSYASYFQFILGNPSSAIINLTQLPIVVYSMLGGKYGHGKAASAMTNAMKMYFKQGGWDKNTDFMPDWTFGATAKGDLLDLYNQAVDRSAIRRGVGYELTEMRKTKTQDYTGTWAKVQHGLGYLFQNSERFNREVTLLAAYNLAKQAGKTHQQAVDEAIKLNTDAHSHALSEAGPQLFQQGWGKVLTTFKRFAQAQIALLLKLSRTAYKGESAEVRSIARKQIASIFGMAYLFSGLQGMPFYGAAEALVSGLYAALGDDDEPFDSAEALREAVGDLGYKGPLNQILGVDIAARTGFNGLLWRDDKKRLAEVGPILYATERLLGPAYSVFYDNPKRALDYLEKDQGERALEAVLPSFLRNILKGVRFANEGALNSKGVPIVEDVSAYNSLMQIFGFTPAQLSEAYARAGAMKSAETYVENRRTALLDALYLAKSNMDADGMADAYEAIANFNAAHPDNPISAKTEKRSESMHNKAMTQYVDGVRLNPKTKNYYVENYGN